MFSTTRATLLLLSGCHTVSAFTCLGRGGTGRAACLARGCSTGATGEPSGCNRGITPPLTTPGSASCLQPLGALAGVAAAAAAVAAARPATRRTRRRAHSAEGHEAAEPDPADVARMRERLEDIVQARDGRARGPRQQPPAWYGAASWPASAGTPTLTTTEAPAKAVSGLDREMPLGGAAAEGYPRLAGASLRGGQGLHDVLDLLALGLKLFIGCLIAWQAVLFGVNLGSSHDAASMLLASALFIRFIRRDGGSYL